MEDLEGLDEIVGEFLVESHENLDQLDRDLVELERAPGSRELLGSIFRTIHTIKGTSGFLAFSQLEAITHVGENLLAKLRDGHLTMTPGTTDVLLAMVDRVRDLLAAIEADGTEGKVEVADVVQRVSEALEGRESSPAQPAASVEEAADPVVVPTAEVPEDLPVVVPEVTPVAVLPDVPAEVPAEAPAERRSVADASIRVDVDLLDSLMRQVGELVLTRNQIVRQTGHGEDLELTRSAQRLDQIATELQEGVMKTRMQPIDHLWAKLPRVVRDLGAACGKQVELVMVGRETELDRSLLESVKDPLTHLVRNAVDHGLESPERRTAAGKPTEGRLTLRAYHQSGQVVVEVCDDGGGIDAAAVAAKAVDKGLRTAAQVALMSQAELLQLIFTPGFSTAAAVTNVSGRGVGMDVVKTNIEAIGGTIEIESVLGRGTTCRLRIPLTLAIVPALVVECAGDTYAIGQVSLLELVALDAERAARAIEDVNGVPVHRLRGVLLPLVRLTDVLGVESTRDDGHVLIAVLQSEGRRFGLVIDRVLSTEDVVVKPLSARIKQLGAYSGATILGDGRVALILDVQGIARRALSSETVEGELDRHDAESTRSEQERWLVAGIGGGRRVALPLEVVTRLETFPRDAIELVGHREVVQYRGEVLPLLRLDHHLSVGSWRDSEPENLVVVIYQSGDRGVAIVVEEIVDIVDEAGRQSDISDRGLTGSVRIRDRVVEVLDVRDAVLAADPGFYDDIAPVGAGSWDAVPALEAM
ncbi:chemotaxis protein CheW [Nocardioides seonyuensis]|uniref:chemotaxis protein CheW n=1 Tax=Nocardioides seonyuensis TaxID=2518371 RepID=UPI001FC9A25C|nr:chemotaxis protein CheW [Nocardioides seonyuensis]